MSTMSKKHYEAVADTLNRTAADYGLLAVPESTTDIAIHQVFSEIVHGIAAVFARDNPQFSRYKFFAAVWRGAVGVSEDDVAADAERAEEAVRTTNSQGVTKPAAQRRVGGRWV